MQNLCIKLAKDIAIKRKAANLSSFSVPSLSHTPRINQSVSKLVIQSVSPSISQPPSQPASQPASLSVN